MLLCCCVLLISTVDGAKGYGAMLSQYGAKGYDDVVWRYGAVAFSAIVWRYVVKGNGVVLLLPYFMMLSSSNATEHWMLQHYDASATEHWMLFLPYFLTVHGKL
jgi:hypothetical protein